MLISDWSSDVCSSDLEIDQYRSVPFNQAKVETSGIDATWKYRFDTDRLGRFDLDLSWTHVLKLDVQDFPGSPVINTRDHMQYFNFRSRVNWTATWTKDDRSEEHTSELQSLMRNSYAVFCLKKKKEHNTTHPTPYHRLDNP